MVERRTVPVTVESLPVFSRIVERGQIRPRKAARWLDARGVFPDACRYPGSQLQGGAACGAAGFRLFTSANGFQKSFQLRAQWFDPSGWQLFKRKLRLGA